MVVTTVLKLLEPEDNIANDGSAEIGVCVVDRVVGTTFWRSDGIGPVTVGYTPVQYETVVVMSGVGKTKLTAMSPYDITLVVMLRTSTEDVLPAPVGETVNEAVAIEKIDDLCAMASVWIVNDSSTELADNVPDVASELKDEVERAEVVIPEPVLDVTPDELDESDNESDNEEEDELVSWLLEEDVVFMGGTRVLNVLGELVPDSPPVVVLVDTLSEEEVVETEVLVKVWLSELDDEDNDGKEEVPNDPVELGTDADDDDGGVGDADDEDTVGIREELTVLKLPELLEEFNVGDGELDEVLDVMDELLWLEAEVVEAEGQENTLELGAAEDVTEETVEEAEVLEVNPCEIKEDEDAVTRIDVFESSVRVVVTPEVTRVTVLVMTEGVLVAVVLMMVVRVLEVVGGTLLDEGIGADELKLITDVLVKIVNDPPGNVFIDMITVADDRRVLLGRDPVSVALTITTEVLVMVIVAPPGMVLVKVVRLLKVVGAMTLGLAEGEAPITVAEVTIDAVV
jgi:hypothetical protein